MYHHVYVSISTGMFNTAIFTLVWWHSALRIKIWTVFSADTNFHHDRHRNIATRFGTKLYSELEPMKKFTSTFVDTAENRRDLSCPSSIRDLVTGQSHSEKISLGNSAAEHFSTKTTRFFSYWFLIIIIYVYISVIFCVTDILIENKPWREKRFKC